MTDSAPTRDTIRDVVEPLRHLDGPLLPMLHAVQRHCGWVPPVAIEVLAEVLNLSRADVHGVVGFYSFFRRQPPASLRIEVCRAESCQAMQGEALVVQLERRLGVACDSPRPGDAVSLQSVYCLGLCAASPALVVDGELQARVTPARCDELLDAWERRA